MSALSFGLQESFSVKDNIFLTFQTVSSITALQATIDDDSICDTLTKLNDNDPQLFPLPTGMYVLTLLTGYFNKLFTSYRRDTWQSINYISWSS